MELGGDTKAVLLAAGLIFVWALLLGIVKFRQMTASPDGLAHPYIDVAHRAALLYSFATLLLATFVQFGGWSDAVNLVAAFGVIFFFVAAIATYTRLGLTRSTDNQWRGETGLSQRAGLWALIVVELAGFGVLLAGFFDAQIL